MPLKPGLTRKKHKKSKLGCSQCKQRRIKCDETLPSCEKCLSRSIRCGYLDYSKFELQKIQVAHWEAAGADPDSDPLIFQDVQLTFAPNDEPISMKNLGEYIPILPSQEDYSSAPSTDSPIQSLDDYQITLISHSTKRKPFSFETCPRFFGETDAGVTSRYYLLSLTHQRIVQGASDTGMFYVHLLLAAGSLLNSQGLKLETEFFKYRGLTMNYIIKNLLELNDSNAVKLLSIITLLNSSSVYLKGRVTYKDHFYLTSGPGGLLKNVFENPSKFPKSFRDIGQFATGLLLSSNYVWFPQYNKRVLWEFFDVLKEFGTKYIENDDDFDDDDRIYIQYTSMIEFMEFCLDVLENQQSSNEVLKYPIKTVLELLQRWHSILPSECFTLGSRSTPVERVFYIFWFTLLNLLEAVIIGARYVFSYFFDGYFVLYTFDKAEMLEGIDDEELIWYMNYLCRTIAYFTRRTSYIMRNTILNNPIPLFSNLNDRLKARALDIQERCITSFKDTVIKKINYPMQSNKSKNFILQHEEENYYGSNDQYESSEDDNVSTLEGLFQNFDTHGEKVDLLNNVNQKTSLLNNDYDPRYIDPIFDNQLRYQRPTLDLINRYLEDRKLIIKMGDHDSAKQL